jgi:hypothetical protein
MLEHELFGRMSCATAEQIEVGARLPLRREAPMARIIAATVHEHPTWRRRAGRR